MEAKNHLVVVHAPLHGTTVTLRQLRRARRLKNRWGTQAHIVCHSEAYRKRWAFRGLARWRTITGPKTPPDPRGRVASWDVVVLVRRRFKTIRKYAFKAADAARPLKIAPDRWIVGWVGVTPAGTTEIICEHPHAAIRGADPGSKRVREYAKQAERFEACIENAQEQNHRTAALGDLNFPRVPDGTAPPYAPQRVFARTKMHDTRNNVLDWISTWGLEIVDLDEIPPSKNGQDHPWFVVTCKPRVEK